jgi:hypothetical protein
MSRMRQLKPSFFEDEDVAELTPWARLLFLGLLGLADRRGRLEERQAYIRVRVFPFDDMETARVRLTDLLDELSRERKHSGGAFIVRYEVGGRRYIQIVNFEKHQKPHPKEAESEIPPAPTVTKKPRNYTARQDLGKTQPRKGVVEPRKGDGEQGLNLNLDSNLNLGTDSAAGASPPAVAKGWGQEFTDDYRAVYKADPSDATRKHVKGVAQRYGWGKTRPVLQAYMRSTPIEFLNVPKALPVWIEGGHSLQEARASPNGKVKQREAQAVANVLGGLRKNDRWSVDGGQQGSSDAARPRLAAGLGGPPEQDPPGRSKPPGG